MSDPTCGGREGSVPCMKYLEQELAHIRELMDAKLKEVDARADARNVEWKAKSVELNDVRTRFLPRTEYVIEHKMLVDKLDLLQQWKAGIDRLETNVATRNSVLASIILGGAALIITLIDFFWKH